MPLYENIKNYINKAKGVVFICKDLVFDQSLPFNVY